MSTTIQTQNIPEKDKKDPLFGMLERPFALIREGGKIGIRGVKSLFLIIFLFCFVNILLLLFAVYKYYTLAVGFQHLGIVFIVFLLGIVFIVWAGYKAYQFVILDTVRVIYLKLEFVFKSICDKIVDKAEKLLLDNVDMKSGKIEQLFSTDQLVDTSYNKLPAFVKSRIENILNKVPILSMLGEVRQVILEKNKAKASQMLYDKINQFITEVFFSNNNNSWIYWFLPLNIAIQLFLIFMNIK